MALAPGREGSLFERRRLPLGAIYILGERHTKLSIPVIEKMEGSEALLNLIANTYVNYVIDSEMRQQEFSALSRLLTNVPVRLVQPPADPSCHRNLFEAIGTNAKKLLAASSISARRGCS